MKLLYLIFVSLFMVFPIYGQEVSTLAGGTQGTSDGTGANAQFNLPFGLTIHGDSLYIADTNNHRIRIVNLKTGEVTTLAGSNEGFNDAVGTVAQFDSPSGIAIRGDSLLIADKDNHRIRLIRIGTGATSTIAGTGTPGSTDGPVGSALLNFPNGVFLSGDSLFVTEEGNHAVRVINISTGQVSTLAGGSQGNTDAVGAAAQFNIPTGIVRTGDVLYVADRLNHRIRTIAISTGQVTTLAGSSPGFNDGTGNAAQFDNPMGIVRTGDVLYVADRLNHRIRTIAISTGQVTTLAGGDQGAADGTGNAAQFDNPSGIARQGLRLFVADRNNHTIRRVDLPRPDLRIFGKIAFTSDRDGDDEIFVMNPDGTNPVRITDNAGQNFNPIWSPDGEKIVFFSNRDGNDEIYVMNADGSNQTRLTDNPASENLPSWSPDGSKITFTSTRDNGDREIYVMDADGSNQTRLTSAAGSDTYPSWSPDGEKIVFVSTRDGGLSQVYTMNPDGSNPTRLVNDGDQWTEPFFSPDGTKILTSLGVAGNEPGDIYVIDADGSNPIQLTDNNFIESHVFWSPDGKRIVFFSNRDGNNEIYTIHADGTDSTRLTDNSVPDEHPTWQPFQHIGTSDINTPASRTMTIENAGDADLIISNITSNDGQFTASPTSFTVAPGDSQDVEVSFTPQAAGTQYATLTITSNGPDDPALSLIINGTGTVGPVIIAIDTTFNAPGQTAKLDLTLDNTGSVPVGGAQFNIYLGDMTKATFAGLSDTLMSDDDGFTVETNVVSDTLKVLVISGSGATLAPGIHLIGRLCFDLVDDNANLGTEFGLSPDEIVVGDESALALETDSRSGLIRIGIRGDVNLDGKVSILDIIKLVRIIIGAEQAPPTGSTAFHIADVNNDGALNIIDVIAQVNIILGLPPASKPVSTSPVAVALNEVIVLPNGIRVVPLTVRGAGVAGLQADLRFDPEAISIGDPVFSSDENDLLIDSHTKDGIMRLSVVGISGAPLPDGATIHIPVTLMDEEAGLILTDVLLANRHAAVINAQIVTAQQTVSGKEAAIPTAFALQNARPNPFNPSTVIAYDVPEQAHITLTIYNLIGQEVIRLVDQMKQPGRYTVTWQGRNAQDQEVASGIYLYRLTSDTGFQDVRRMTLIK